MFDSPFSFKGRIRRREYGLSYLEVILGFFLISLVGEFYVFEPRYSVLVMIPVYWFWIAQSAKRCHDRGHSGWWQLIPFYSVYLFLADSQPDPNRYGPNPKAVLREEREDILDIV